MQLDAVVREYLANPRDVLSIACEAVEAFADDDVDDTGLCGLDDLRQSRAVPPVTRELRIYKGVDDDTAEAVDQ
ncbi:hypothetical protein [Sphingomonas sp. PAMC26645]|uniref:hypothetical protein n=1 Tax=Sphingomonas sp. PAMC26645 TaxID=2565555 RepID=UPI001FFA5432|nr:hypothetical protein [Sphingomonas sp. PAMC26645]